MNIHGERLLLEQYACGEFDKPTRQLIDEHIGQCDECSAFVTRLSGEQEAFLQKHPFASFDRAHAPVAGLPWYKTLLNSFIKPTLVPVYASLLIAVIILPMVLREYGNNTPAIQYKGKNPVSFQYQRDGITKNGSPGDRFHAGDKIQITFSTVEEKQVALLSIDSKGTVSFYHPDERSDVCSVKTPAGANQQFPGSIILDATKGYELVIALFADKPLETDETRNWIAALYRENNSPEKINNLLKKSSRGIDASVSTVLLTKE